MTAVPDATMAIARARGYAVLSELLLGGGVTLDPRAVAAIDPQATDLDELATQYVAAFDLGVPPYASTFLEPDGIVGGSITCAIADAIGTDGQRPATDEVAACHLGVLLGHAARLCGSGRDGDAADFLRRFVLPWLPAYTAAIEQLPAPFWTAVVHLTLDVVVDQCGAESPVHDDATSAPVDPLADPGAGLREVASFLASAARCGLYLTEPECAAIGRALDLPRGFGPRRARLETLLRSAAEYGSFVALCDALDAVATSRTARLGAIARDRGGCIDARDTAARIAAMRRVLATLRSGAQHVTTDPSTAAAESGTPP